jgi:endonuclease/exonuclease/phosphatase family metal-dependent hydrolase
LLVGGRDALEELVAALEARGKHYVAVRAITHFAWNMYDEGVAVLSRVPVLASHVETLPMGIFPRKLVAIRADAGAGRTFVFGGTHFDYQDATVRAAQASTCASTLAALASPGDAKLLAGDLNEQPGGMVATTFTAAGFTDAADAGPTFPSDGPSIRIDYIYASGIGATAADRILTTPVNSVYASDHVGLKATFK